MKKSTNSAPLIVRTLESLDRAILKAWTVFRSLKFGIFLLALIGIVSIWGTMGYASNAALGDNSITMARTLVFENRYFVALLLLFALNLIVSTWHVTEMSFGIWWKKEFRRDPSYYSPGMTTPRAEVAVPGGEAEVEQVLSRQFTRAHRDGKAFFAHKGLLSRMGPTIVHAGMLLVIFAVVAKAVLIWNGKIVTEGRFVAAEGEQMSFISQPAALEQQITEQNRQDIPLDVWVRVLDFDEVKHPNSQVPAHFRSLVEVRDPETQEVTVAQLDMNHSLGVKSKKYGTLRFHQAGYQPMPGSMDRIDFDVRDAKTGERIAVTDTVPGDRVRVGETDSFLEVDGINPGDHWRLYKASAPNDVAAEGLLVGGRNTKFSFKPLEFYPDFRIDENTKKPTNASNLPRNPALRVGIMLDGRQVDETWLFFDKQLAALVPPVHPRFDLKLSDVRVPPDVDPATMDWTKPENAVFDITVIDKNGASDRTVSLSVGDAAKDIVYTSKVDHAGVTLGSENGYEVRIIGPAQRYITVLSVVSDPTVGYIVAGVLIILAGAMMTFLFRYRSFYGVWNPERGTLSMALVPRWGQSPVQEEFDRLVMALSHGAGPISTETPAPVPTTEPQTAERQLAEV